MSVQAGHCTSQNFPRPPHLCSTRYATWSYNHNKSLNYNTFNTFPLLNPQHSNIKMTPSQKFSSPTARELSVLDAVHFGRGKPFLQWTVPLWMFTWAHPWKWTLLQWCCRSAITTLHDYTTSITCFHCFIWVLRNKLVFNNLVKYFVIYIWKLLKIETNACIFFLSVSSYETALRMLNKKPSY